MTAQQMVEQFLRHRRATEHFCALMPDEKYDFRAWEGAMSFGAMATHIANAGDFYLAVCEGIKPTRPDPSTQPATPAEIRAYLARKTAEQAERIGRLGDDLDRAVTFRDRSLPLGVLLGQMREHEAHHKGQLLLMLRMVGVQGELAYTAG